MSDRRFWDHWEAWESDPAFGGHFAANPQELPAALARIANTAYRWGMADHPTTGVVLLDIQVDRLRATPGVPFNFTPAGVARSVADELAEVRACEPGSARAKEELGDLFATVLSLADAHGFEPLEVMEEAAAKLARRLHLVDQGATWEEAKRAEADAKWEATVAKAAPYLPGGEHWVAACDGDHAAGSCPAERCIRRDTFPE